MIGELNYNITFLYFKTLYWLVQFQRIWRVRHYVKVNPKKLKNREITGKGVSIPITTLKPSFIYGYKFGAYKFE